MMAGNHQSPSLASDEQHGVSRGRLRLSSGLARSGILNLTVTFWKIAMTQYVGLDVSLKVTALCVVDHDGGLLAEGKVTSESEALAEASARGRRRWLRRRR
jgi:hypothetical protein